jgi:glycosyltransferase involved in cell wall biosynthesis
MKIGLTLLCKDEIDIIKQWIDYHIFRFDYTIIQDNGSTDGTLEYLRSIQSDTVFIISIPEQTYKQSEWVYAMDCTLRNLECVWAVNADADEFLDGDVRASCMRAGTLQQIYSHGTFMRPTVLDLNIENPIERITYHDPWELKYSNDKAIVNLTGLIGICQGNHWGFWNGKVNSVFDPSLRLYHYEQRSIQQFIKKYKGHWTEEKLKNMGEGWQAKNKLWVEGGDAALVAYYNEHVLVSEEGIKNRKLTKL